MIVGDGRGSDEDRRWTARIWFKYVDVTFAYDDDDQIHAHNILPFHSPQKMELNPDDQTWIMPVFSFRSFQLCDMRPADF